MLQDRVVTIISNAKKKINAAGGLRAVYYVGCGGSWAASQVGFRFIETENHMGLSTGHVNSNEFVHATPGVIGKGSMVIVTSMKATAESVEALRKAKKKGAYTIAITGADDTLMAKTADAYVVYTHTDHWTCAFHSQAVALRIAVEIVKQFDKYPHYKEMIGALDSLDARYEGVKARFIRDGIKFGATFKDDPVIHVFSCGLMYGAGYGACYCHLAEMQQKNAIPINSAEYFHGPFEITVPEQASVLFMNVGRYRELDERAWRFLTKFCDRLFVIDAKDFDLGDLREDVAEYIAPFLMSPLFRMYVERMSEERGHPMTKRRYMWKLDY